MTNVDGLLLEAVSSGQVSGVVAMAVANGCPPYTGAYGVRASLNSSRMSTDTVFQVEALLRPVMAVAALQLVDSGVIGLDQPLRTVIPALSRPSVLTGFNRRGAPVLRPARGEITLRQVLSHTAGLAVGSWWQVPAEPDDPLGMDLWGESPRADTVVLLADPGTRWLHCSDADVVGMIIEQVSGMTAAEYLEGEIFLELGMRDTGFDVGPRSRAKLAGGWLEHDGLDGYGSFYTTPKDYFEFVEAVLWGDQSLLSPESFELLRSNQIGALPVPKKLDLREVRTPGELNFYPEIRLHPAVAATWSLGFMVNPEDIPDGPEAGTLSCAGDANSYCWMDPAAGVAGLMFAQPKAGRPDGAEALFGMFQRAVYAGRRAHLRRGEVSGPSDDWPHDTSRLWWL